MAAAPRTSGSESRNLPAGQPTCSAAKLAQEFLESYLERERKFQREPEPVNQAYHWALLAHPTYQEHYASGMAGSGSTRSPSIPDELPNSVYMPCAFLKREPVLTL